MSAHPKDIGNTYARQFNRPEDAARLRENDQRKQALQERIEAGTQPHEAMAEFNRAVDEEVERHAVEPTSATGNERVNDAIAQAKAQAGERVRAASLTSEQRLAKALAAELRGEVIAGDPSGDIYLDDAEPEPPPTRSTRPYSQSLMSPTTGLLAPMRQATRSTGARTARTTSSSPRDMLGRKQRRITELEGDLQRTQEALAEREQELAALRRDYGGAMERVNKLQGRHTAPLFTTSTSRERRLTFSATARCSMAACPQKHRATRANFVEQELRRLTAELEETPA
jgi:hypothetical protein